MSFFWCFTLVIASNVVYGQNNTDTFVALSQHSSILVNQASSSVVFNPPSTNAITKVSSTTVTISPPYEAQSTPNVMEISSPTIIYKKSAMINSTMSLITSKATTSSIISSITSSENVQSQSTKTRSTAVLTTLTTMGTNINNTELLMSKATVKSSVMLKPTDSVAQRATAMVKGSERNVQSMFSTTRMLRKSSISIFQGITAESTKQTIISAKRFFLVNTTEILLTIAKSTFTSLSTALKNITISPKMGSIKSSLKLNTTLPTSSKLSISTTLSHVVNIQKSFQTSAMVIINPTSVNNREVPAVLGNKSRIENVTASTTTKINTTVSSSILNSPKPSDNISPTFSPVSNRESLAFTTNSTHVVLLATMSYTTTVPISLSKYGTINSSMVKSPMASTMIRKETMLARSVNKTASLTNPRVSNSSIAANVTVYSSVIQQATLSTGGINQSMVSYVRTPLASNMTNSMTSISYSLVIFSTTLPSSSEFITTSRAIGTLSRSLPSETMLHVLANSSTVFVKPDTVTVSIQNTHFSKSYFTSMTILSPAIVKTMSTTGNTNMARTSSAASTNANIESQVRTSSVVNTSRVMVTEARTARAVNTNKVMVTQVRSSFVNPSTAMESQVRASSVPNSNKVLEFQLTISPVGNMSKVTATQVHTSVVNTSTAMQTYVRTSSSIVTQAQSSPIININMSTHSHVRTSTPTNTNVMATQVRTSQISLVESIFSHAAISVIEYSSISRVITPFPSEIVFVRLTIDASCSQVPNHQSTTFKNAVRSSFSKILNIPDSKINISAVICGSITVDMGIENANNQNLIQIMENYVKNKQLYITYNGTQLEVTSVKEIKTTPTVKRNDGDDYDTAFIVYIVLGSVLALAFIIGIVVLIWRCRRERSTGMFHLPSDENLELSDFSAKNKAYWGANFYGEVEPPESIDPQVSDIAKSKPASNDLEEDSANGGSFGSAYLPAWKNLLTVDMSEVPREDDIKEANDNLRLTYRHTAGEEDLENTGFVASYDNIGAV